MSEHPSSAISHPLSTGGGAKRLPTPVKITEQSWPEGTVPVVTIRCITYNHAKFIRDAIEGFLMQETTFPVEILIHDDASTDGTADIIREYAAKYPQVFHTVFQTENQYSKGSEAWARVREHVGGLVRGEFIALCEGDDYWTSAEKLQKQVEALEQSLDCALCFHNALLLDDTGALERARPMHEDLGKNVFETKDLLRQWFIPTASIMYRNYPDFEMPSWVEGCQSGDIPLLLLLSLKGNLCYLSETMSVYRLHVGGMSKTHLGHKKVLAMTYVYQSFNLHTNRRFEPYINEAILYEIRCHMPECQQARQDGFKEHCLWFYYRARIAAGALKQRLWQRVSRRRPELL